MTNAISSFAALSQETRLKALQLLIRHEPDGLPAGKIADMLNVPHNTMSSHLAILERAGWISSQRSGRSIIYAARLEQVRAIIWYLMSECCQGRPEVCMPFIMSSPCQKNPAENS